MIKKILISIISFVICIFLILLIIINNNLKINIKEKFNNNMCFGSYFPILTDTNGTPINPIAWWKFDDGALTTDSSGNGYTLTAYADAPRGNIPVANTTDYVRGNASVSFNKNLANYYRLLNPFNFYNVWNGTGISFSFWFKYTIYGSIPEYSQ